MNAEREIAKAGFFLKQSTQRWWPPLCMLWPQMSQYGAGLRFMAAMQKAHTPVLLPEGRAFLHTAHCIGYIRLAIFLENSSMAFMLVII
jgi:hypothetical protein